MLREGNKIQLLSGGLFINFKHIFNFRLDHTLPLKCVVSQYEFPDLSFLDMTEALTILVINRARATLHVYLSLHVYMAMLKNDLKDVNKGVYFIY